MSDLQALLLDPDWVANQSPGAVFGGVDRAFSAPDAPDAASAE